MNNVLIFMGNNPHLDWILSQMIVSQDYDVKAVVGVNSDSINTSTNIMDPVELRHVGYFSSADPSNSLNDKHNELLFMLNRFINLGEVSNNIKLDFIKKTVGYWESWLEEKKINLVIFPCIPHELYDYVIFLLAKKQNIKTIIFEKTFWKDKIMIFDEFRGEAYKLINCKPIIQNNSKRIQREFLRIRENIPPHWTKSKIKNSSGIFKRLFSVIKRKKIRVEYPGFYNGKYLTRGMLDNKSSYWHLYVRLKIEIKKIAIYMEYWRFSQFMLGAGKKYIVFFLQTQPEKSTSPLGGEFYDQIKAIDCLRRWMPKGVDLVVREHPSQFKQFQNPHKGRYLGFYRSLCKTGAILLNNRTDKSELISNSIGVINITGSVAIESYIQGKKSGYMGFPWYANIQGVNSVSSREDLIEFINSEYLISDSQIKDELDNFLNTINNGFFSHKDAHGVSSKNIQTCSSEILNCINVSLLH